MKKFVLVLFLSFAASSSLAQDAQLQPFATGQNPLPTPPDFTWNLGVRSIDAGMYRVVHELTKNVSARLTALDARDKARMDAMYADLLQTVDTVGVAGTETCTTDFHYLFTLNLTDFTEPVLPVENEAINSAVMYLYGSNIGLRISQSTRRNDCLEATDYEDLVDGINKSKDWLDKFFANSSPLDMPQSHPQRDIINPTAPTPAPAAP